MDDNQKQVVLGSLLGNAFICKGEKNYYLCIRHTLKHSPWLQHKTSMIAKYGSATPWYSNNHTMTWRSIAHPIFAEFKQICYTKNNKKTVTMDWLDRLQPIGIAIWYGDQGSLNEQNNATIRTPSLGKEGGKIIERFFNEVKLPCSYNKSLITFTDLATKKLTCIIADYLPTNRIDVNK